ncbi:MAG: nucleoside-diphosphate kinase [Clostridiales bacterium]|nr:nucleoside-diphosphate kinase [Clostridiales bacterium]
MERTLALIKPDGVEKNKIGEVITFYEKAGLKVVALKMEQITKEFAKEHYAEHKGKDFYEELITFITRGPLVAIVLEGENAVETVRKVNGATNPNEAKEGTIRYAFGTDKTQNCVHASDSIINAKNEISKWFPEV